MLATLLPIDANDSTDATREGGGAGLAADAIREGGGAGLVSAPQHVWKIKGYPCLSTSTSVREIWLDVNASDLVGIWVGDDNASGLVQFWVGDDIAHGWGQIQARCKP